MRLTAEQRRRVLSHPAGWIASGLGAGLAPVAPGTVGSLVALPLFVGMALVHPLAPWIGIGVYFALGVWAAGRVIAVLRVEDPGVVVADEFVGQWLALAMIDLALRLWPDQLVSPSRLAVLVAGFLLFRICDIAKPWPASWADRTLTGGFGAMLDDVFAGIWAGALAIAGLWGVAALR